MLFLVLQIVFVVPKVNHALSGKSVLQMLKLNSRTDQILAANAVDHFFWRKDLRNISDYNFDKPKKKSMYARNAQGPDGSQTFRKYFLALVALSLQVVDLTRRTRKNIYPVVFDVTQWTSLWVALYFYTFRVRYVPVKILRL